MTSSPAPRLDSDAVLWSTAQKDRGDRPVLVLMHGLLSHEGDLFQLTPYLPLEPVIASLRAPIDRGTGYAWFPLGEPGSPDPALVDAAADAVLAWLDAELPDAVVGLLGFSQGGAMALQLLRRAPERFAFAVNLSGFLAPSPTGIEADAALADLRPRVFWGRGTADAIITPQAIARTEEWLPEHSTLDSRIYEGLAHGISEEELADVAAFIRAGFAAA